VDLVKQETAEHSEPEDKIPYFQVSRQGVVLVVPVLLLQIRQETVQTMPVVVVALAHPERAGRVLVVVLVVMRGRPLAGVVVEEHPERRVVLVLEVPEERLDLATYHPLAEVLLHTERVRPVAD